MQLRELIKKIRQEKSWTQVQLGAALAINQQDVQGMENAGRNLKVSGDDARRDRFFAKNVYLPFGLPKPSS